MARKRYKNLMMLAAAVLTGAMATSCVEDNSECIEDRPGYEEGNDVWLSFDVKNSAAEERVSSRAGNDTGGHPEEDSEAAENHLNDWKLMLLDDRKQVIKVFDQSELTRVETDKEHREYKLVAKVNKQYFDYALGEDIKLSLLMVANTENNSKDGTGFPDVSTILWSKNATDLAAAHYTFTHPYGAWMPEIDKARIPMAGLKHYTIKRSTLEASTADKPYDIDLETGNGDMYVQRAMAKIRVIDAIEDAGLGIESVTLSGGNTKGTYMPDFTLDGATDWANGTVDIEKATTEAGWYAPTATVSLVDKGTYTVTEDGATKTYDHHWIGYMPEWESATPGQEPVLIITSKDGKEWKKSLNDELKVSSFVRNHIYEFTVTRAMEGEITLKYIVCPWRPYEVTIPPFD